MGRGKIISGVLAALLTGRQGVRCRYCSGPRLLPAIMAGQRTARSFPFGPVPEETVMSITAWIVPGRAAGCQSGWANR